HRRWQVAVLGIAELPNLVGLEAPAVEVPHVLVQVGPAHGPDVHHELEHRVEGGIRHAGRRPNRVALDQRTDQSRPPIRRKLVHGQEYARALWHCQGWASSGEGLAYFVQRALAALGAG